MKKTIRIDSDVKAVQNIMRLLTDFDEKSGRVTMKNPDQLAGHYARKAVGNAPDGNVYFVVERTGKAVYSITGFLKSENVYLDTTWVHEDGILIEREQLSDQPGHPVHSIECLTDIFDRTV